jgi:SpoVK/Ycf46/Vps4 family AAA+-type ATPase
VFDYLGAEYDAPDTPGWNPRETLASDFLDCPVTFETGDAASLRAIIEQGFLRPLIRTRNLVAQGKRFPDDVDISAILYGPPGTSKTHLARQIADCLAWPLLSIDPSHLTRKGLGELHAEANRVFTMLNACEQIVVFMDEFDELVRDREAPGEMESRFLTTAMLPKLADLSERRRLVYLLATNHLERFDTAIRHPGRFDTIWLVMPPTYAAKEERWPIIRERVDEADPERRPELIGMITDLTFGEMATLVKRLERGDGLAEEIIAHEHGRSTLEQPVGDRLNGAENWKKRVASQRQKIRVHRIV